ncbi:hypothetical protein FRC03_005894 [Tulasnella sp. 419]|nr:hypothetical protein FRC03_005894 [Tulasnella sp. 419]
MTTRPVLLLYTSFSFLFCIVRAQSASRPQSIVTRTPTATPRKSSNAPMIGAVVGAVILFLLFVALGIFVALRRGRSQRALVEQIEHNRQEARKSRLDLEKQKLEGQPGSPFLPNKGLETPRTASPSSDMISASSPQHSSSLYSAKRS